MAKFNFLVHKISGAKYNFYSFETSDFDIANTELDKLWKLAKTKFPNLDSLESTLEIECNYETNHCNISVPLVSDENGLCLVQVRDGFIFNNEWHKLNITEWKLEPDEDQDPLLDYVKICMRVFLFERDGPFSAAPTVVFNTLTPFLNPNIIK